MAASFVSRRSLAYASAIVATGGAGLFLTSRPRETYTPPTNPLKRDQNGNIIPPQFPKVKSRQEQLIDLKRYGGTGNANDEYDLLVIGAGATGAGIALDAVSRGLKVALVERDDFSSGTSSRSTKLVHGGVRYLEKAVWNLDYNQYELVREALRERKAFLYTAPHLSQSLPILLPLQSWLKAPYLWAGVKAYDLLAGSKGLESSYLMTKQRAIEAFPLLKKDNLVGALVYYDGQHNDSRMNVAIAMTAAHYGATTLNHLEVTGLEKDATGKLCGARVRDLVPDHNQTSEEFTIRAKGIVNATGPFCDAIRQMDEPGESEIVAPSSGVHLVLPGHLAPNNLGLLDASTSDGRVMFFLPWQGNVIAGTTDAPCSVSRNPEPSEDDIKWILKEVRKYLSPDVVIRRQDVLAAWSGIRPLVRDPAAKNSSSIVRNHLVTVSKSGLLTCAGGKWTTYRQMAEDAVDEVIKTFKLAPRKVTSQIPDISGTLASGASELSLLDGTCQTLRLRLVGAHGYSPTMYINLIQHFGLEASVAQQLAHNYGDRAWEVARLSTPSTDTPTSEYPFHGQKLHPSYPFIDGEIRYAVHNEYAQTAVDVLARRTRLSFLDANAALSALPKVIDTMTAELGWDEQRREVEWNETIKFLTTMGLDKSKVGVKVKHSVTTHESQPIVVENPHGQGIHNVLPELAGAVVARAA